MADKNDAKNSAATDSELQEGDKNITEEPQEDESTSSAEAKVASSNDSTLDARAQLATLISLVQSIESSTGEPDHKKVVYEVFGTVFIQLFYLVCSNMKY